MSFHKGMEIDNEKMFYHKQHYSYGVFTSLYPLASLSVQLIG